MRIQRRVLGGILFSLLFPIAGGIALWLLGSEVRFVDEAVHSSVESATAIAALCIAALLCSSERFRVHRPLRFVASALIGTGLLTLSHSLLHVTPAFFWSRSLATLVAGTAIALVWISERPGGERLGKIFPWLVGGVTACLGVALVAFPHALPEMFDRRGFVSVAKAINIIAGMGFLGASTFFFRAFFREGPGLSLCLAYHCLLLGTAALLFPLSFMWGPVWWYFHLLRFGAYWLVLSFLFREMNLHARELEQQKAELARVAEERRLTEERLRAREVQLNAVLFQIPAFVWSVDRDLMITTSNGAGLKGINVVPGELVGKSLFDYLGTRDASHPAVLQHRRAIAGESLTFDAENNGRHLFSHLEPLRDAGGTIIGAIGAGLDITDQKVLEKDLARSNRELEQFAHIVSHDLREPMRMISQFLALLVKRCGPQLGAEATEYVQFALDGADRLRGLLDGLLRYARVGAANREPVEVDLTAVLRHVRTDLRILLEETGARLLVDSLPVVRGDEALLGQLFQNLVENAVKYRKQGVPSVIRVGCRESGNEWTFSVADNGIGFNSNHGERIFHVFQRLHRTEYSGIGLGLAICKRILELHDGKIWAEAREGEGATFYFTLPRTDERSSRAA